MDPVALRQALSSIRAAAADRRRVVGATHAFYAHPARFSPTFAAAAIRAFSRSGDLVCDPYMGGGTTVVEALRSGRHVVGCDLNELALFVTRVKTTPLTSAERQAVADWAEKVIPHLSYHDPAPPLDSPGERRLTKNLTIPRARFLKKFIHLALLSSDGLPTLAAREFARCALLRAGQWALNGKRTLTPLPVFRVKARDVLLEMLRCMDATAADLMPPNDIDRRWLIHGDAAALPTFEPFASGRRADLVVTSPPYPKIHILYHRWQVDGRRETPAPYWISQSSDGQGASFYNFADRHEKAIDGYFARSLETLHGIRRIMRPGAHIVQMLAFGNPEMHLPRYLENMKEAGFRERRPTTASHDAPLTSYTSPPPGRHSSVEKWTIRRREGVPVVGTKFLSTPPPAARRRVRQCSGSRRTCPVPPAGIDRS